MEKKSHTDRQTDSRERKIEGGELESERASE